MTPIDPRDPIDPLDPPDPTNHDAFAFEDAAYVLGALTDAERASYESHVAQCALCTARVAELRPVVALLGAVTEHDITEHDITERDVTEHEVDDASARPADLLGSLLTRVARRRQRQRWALAGLAGAAAAAVVALVVVVAVNVGGQGTVTAGAIQTMAPVAGSAQIRATASLTSEPWGTSISLDCSYTTAYPGDRGVAYGLRVTDRDGVTHDLGSWTLQPGTDTRFTSGVAIPPAAVRVIEITRPDGTPVMRLTT